MPALHNFQLYIESSTFAAPHSAPEWVDLTWVDRDISDKMITDKYVITVKLRQNYTRYFALTKLFNIGC